MENTISAYMEMAQQPVFKSQYINGNYYSLTTTALPSMVAVLPVVFHNKINSSVFSSVPEFLLFVTLVLEYFTHTK